MDIENVTVEDCLELLAGFQDIEHKFTIDSTDVSLIRSLATQVLKGTALTDRQLSLSVEKLKVYESQFGSVDISISSAIDGFTRMPLRSIDRSKYIKLITDQQERNLIEVRFPFNKKTICQLDEIKTLCFQKVSNLYYDKHNVHSHRFSLNEVTAFYLIDCFKNKQFEIEESLLSYYNKLKNIFNNQKDFVPGIYNLEYKNIKENTLKFLHDEFGQPDIDNLYLFKDRQKSLGLEYFDAHDLQKSVSELSVLSRNIINRNKSSVLIKPKSWSVDQLAFSITELDRFPLVILVDENTAFDNLITWYNSFKQVIDNKDVSVLLRLDNTTDNHINFNTFVKEANLNNPVAQNTKIVYINKNNVPKPLVKEQWRPSAFLMSESFRLNEKTRNFVSTSDLIIHYDNQPSTMFSWPRAIESYNTTIEEI